MHSILSVDYSYINIFLVTIWSTGNALEMAAVDLETKLFWANIQYFAYCFSPITLLTLCMEFTGYDGLVKNKKIWWLLVIPTITIILVWTDELHGLIRHGIHMNHSGDLPVIAKKYGPMFFCSCCIFPFCEYYCLDAYYKSCACQEFSIQEASICIVLGIRPDFHTKYIVYFWHESSEDGIVIGRLAVIYDITHKKQSEKELLKQQWELAVTAKRERMAKDMHDNLSQVLGFINLQAQGIRQELLNEGVEVASEKLDELVNVTQEAHNEIREYIHNARSAAFMEIDFIAALKKEIMKFERQTGIEVKLEIPSEFTGEKLEPITRLNIINVIKEALNNAEKHAESDGASIWFSMSAQELSIIIEDYGKGFDSNLYEYHSHKKFGLNIMRERAAEIGAQLDIQSS
ncbi:histidine kinase N-terminal 7TM domain-containing protein [Lutispora thermophila]|nr:histidine kinase N-terminal 7TM domain-containing protein [Lutispora thermophila]